MNLASSARYPRVRGHRTAGFGRITVFASASVSIWAASYSLILALLGHDGFVGRWRGFHDSFMLPASSPARVERV